MYKWILVTALSVGLTACTQPPTIEKTTSVSPCNVGTYEQADILTLKADKYQGIETPAINQIALDLRPCIGHPRPEIRDGLVYESLSGFLRGEQLTDETKLQLFGHMLGLMNGPYIEPGYTRPFAALDMSELARADRITPYLSDEQREALVHTTASYMTGITDYRGFVDTEGWRHNIAHTADIILQLSLNPNVTEAQLRTLQIALGTQIAPASGHTYIHGEPERMARAILYIARRGVITPDDWNVWFSKLADPEPLAVWSEAYKSEAGLAKLNNTKAFLSSIYINATETQNPDIKALLGPAREVLMKLP